MHSEPLRATITDDESMPWMPFAPHAPAVLLKLLKLDPADERMVLLLKAPAAARLPRLHYAGPAFVYTTAGRWRVEEADWIAGPGSLVSVLAGARQTPQAVGESGEVLTLNVVSGDVSLLDPAGAVLAVENCASMLRRYLDWCASAGIAPRELDA